MGTLTATRPGSLDRESEALAWMADPLGYFDHSMTAMHSVPRRELEAIQLAGLRLRLTERRACRERGVKDQKWQTETLPPWGLG